MIFSDIAYVVLKEAESERKKEDGTKDYRNILENDLFASVAVENKIPLATISRCLGHSTIFTTERFYLQFGNVDQDDVRFQLIRELFFYGSLC